MAYNQSKLKLYRRCQRAYAFRHETVEGKELVPRSAKVQLQRGTWLHGLQEAYFRGLAEVEGPTWEQVHEGYADAFAGLFAEERAELGDLPAECERLFKAYLRRYGPEDHSRYRVARLPGGDAAVEFVVECSLGKASDQPFKGRVDLLIEDLEYGGIWIRDAKWVKSVPSDDERMMSPQSLLYPWALKRCFGIEVAGFIYDYGRTKPPTIPQPLKSGRLSIAARMDTDYRTYLQAIKDLHGEGWRSAAKTVYADKLKELKAREALWFRRERIPVDLHRVEQAVREMKVTVRQIERRTEGDKRHPPRSYFYNCRWGCDYHDLCVAEFNGLDTEALMATRYQLTEERYGADTDLLDA